MKFLSALVFSALLAAPALAADKLPLTDISGYLNSIGTAEAEFTQINDDGTISTGKLFIKRPGKMRFQYNAPDESLVIAANNAVVIFDKKSNQPAETYPLARTPLSIILARTVDLSRASMVTGHSFDGTATLVTAQDPENPEYGNIQLGFTDAPVELRQWIVNDANGGQTTVILGALTTGTQLPNSLFNPDRPYRPSDR